MIALLTWSLKTYDWTTTEYENERENAWLLYSLGVWIHCSRLSTCKRWRVLVWEVISVFNAHSNAWTLLFFLPTATATFSASANDGVRDIVSLSFSFDSIMMIVPFDSFLLGLYPSWQWTISPLPFSLDITTMISCFLHQGCILVINPIQYFSLNQILQIALILLDVTSKCRDWAYDLQLCTR